MTGGPLYCCFDRGASILLLPLFSYMYIYIYTYVYPRMFQDIPIVYIPMFVTSFLGV